MVSLTIHGQEQRRRGRIRVLASSSRWAAVQRRSSRPGPSSSGTDYYDDDPAREGGQREENKGTTCLCSKKGCCSPLKRLIGSNLNGIKALVTAAVPSVHPRRSCAMPTTNQRQINQHRLWQYEAVLVLPSHLSHLPSSLRRVKRRSSTQSRPSPPPPSSKKRPEATILDNLHLRVQVGLNSSSARTQRSFVPFH